MVNVDVNDTCELGRGHVHFLLNDTSESGRDHVHFLQCACVMMMMMMMNVNSELTPDIHTIQYRVPRFHR